MPCDRVDGFGNGRVGRGGGIRRALGKGAGQERDGFGYLSNLDERLRLLH